MIMNRDISNWGWGQVLELPDHLFGRRFVTGCSMVLGAAGTVYGISEMGLPERCVIWEMLSTVSASTLQYVNMSLALGDHLPANDAEFDRLEQLFPDMGYRMGVRRDYYLGTAAQHALRGLKVGVDTSGGRLVARFNKAVGGMAIGEVELVVSSVPRSLPEWFV